MVRACFNGTDVDPARVETMIGLTRSDYLTVFKFDPRVLLTRHSRATVTRSDPPVFWRYEACEPQAEVLFLIIFTLNTGILLPMAARRFPDSENALKITL